LIEVSRLGQQQFASVCRDLGGFGKSLQKQANVNSSRTGSSATVEMT